MISRGTAEILKTKPTPSVRKNQTHGVFMTCKETSVSGLKICTAETTTATVRQPIQPDPRRVSAAALDSGAVVAVFRVADRVGVVEGQAVEAGRAINFQLCVAAAGTILQVSCVSPPATAITALLSESAMSVSGSRVKPWLNDRIFSGGFDESH